MVPPPSTTAVLVNFSGISDSACRQVASGSVSTAISAGTSGASRWMQRTGTATSSANPPGRVPPIRPR